MDGPDDTRAFQLFGEQNVYVLAHVTMRKFPFQETGLELDELQPLGQNLQTTTFSKDGTAGDVKYALKYFIPLISFNFNGLLHLCNAWINKNLNYQQ